MRRTCGVAAGILALLALPVIELSDLATDSGDDTLLAVGTPAAPAAPPAVSDASAQFAFDTGPQGSPDDEVGPAGSPELAFTMQPAASSDGADADGTLAFPDQPGGAPSDEVAADPTPELAFALRPPGDDGDETAQDRAPSDEPYETTLRLDKGDTLSGLLGDLGFAAQDVAEATEVLRPEVNLKRLPHGLEVAITVGPPPDAEGKPVLLALSMRPDARRSLTVQRGEDGSYHATQKLFEIVSRLQRAAGTIAGSLIASARAAGVPQHTLAELLRAFSWDVNFQHDIKAGDRFDLLMEQAWTVDGREIDGGRLLWAELTTNRGARTLSVYRFAPQGGDDFFYNRQGESVKRALLRTPLNLSRISSRFGMRRHPLLGFTRLHAGIDFAAPTGTPVLAAGDGRIVAAGPNGGYGRWVEIDHGGGVATGYAHMSRIAAGIRRSARVHQGQLIGFVGTTGLSTGPHLHFELHRSGKPVNPLGIAKASPRQRLSGADLARFKKRMREIDQARDTAATME